MQITTEQATRTLPARTFWWDRARSADAEVTPLRAVIFDLDALGAEGQARDGLADLVLSLFAAGVWLGVVSSGRRECVGPLVRELIGDGLVETIVSADDLSGPGDDAELYRLALWELGIAPESALAITGSGGGCRAATAAGLPVAVIADDTADPKFAMAGTARSDYDGLLVEGCRQLWTRWRAGRLNCGVAA